MLQTRYGVHMIEIVAKDYNHFYKILREFNIAEEKAIFIPQTIIVCEKDHTPPIYETNVKVDGSDWCDYRSFH